MKRERGESVELTAEGIGGRGREFPIAGIGMNGGRESFPGFSRLVLPPESLREEGIDAERLHFRIPGAGASRTSIRSGAFPFYYSAVLLPPRVTPFLERRPQLCRRRRIELHRRHP